MGAASLAHNVQEGNVGAAIVDGAGLVVDIGAAAIPFVLGGAGAAIKGARGVNTAVNVAQAANTVDNVADGVRYGDEAVTAINVAGDGVSQAFETGVDLFAFGNKSAPRPP